jgi:hypothetical protein
MIKLPVLIAVLVASHGRASGQLPAPEVAHAQTEFHFTVNLPYDDTFPLFGAWEERKWAPDWKPQFLFPHAGADREGAVFLVNHRSHSSVWMLTRFDRTSGRVQYAFVLNNAVAACINIAIKAHAANKTDVSVSYEWTALDPNANEHVRDLAKQYEGAGAEWETQINSYASRLKQGR